MRYCYSAFVLTRHFIGDNGSLSFWDYKTGKPFQHLNDIPQSGSLDSEAVRASLWVKEIHADERRYRASSARRSTRRVRD